MWVLTQLQASIRQPHSEQVPFTVSDANALADQDSATLKWRRLKDLMDEIINVCHTCTTVQSVINVGGTSSTIVEFDHSTNGALLDLNKEIQDEAKLFCFISAVTWVPMQLQAGSSFMLSFNLGLLSNSLFASSACGRSGVHHPRGRLN